MNNDIKELDHLNLLSFGPGLVVHILVHSECRSQAWMNVEGCVRKSIRHKIPAKSNMRRQMIRCGDPEREQPKEASFLNKIIKCKIKVNKIDHKELKQNNKIILTY